MAKVLTTDNISSMLSAIRDYIDDKCEKLANGCSVSLTGTGVTLSTSNVDYLKPAVIEVEEEEGASILTIAITMDGVDITSSAWDDETNSIIISKVVGDIGVTITTASLLTTTLDGVSLSNRTVKIGNSWTASLIADSGKQVLPASVVITMEGVDITSTVYDFSGNTITIPNVTGEINVVASSVTMDSAYKPVEYIQNLSPAAGKRFVTDYKPTNLTEVILDVNILEAGTNCGVLGTRTDSTPYFAIMGRYSTGNYGRGYWGNKTLETSAFGAYVKPAIRQTITIGKGSLTYYPNGGSAYRTVTFDSTQATPWTSANVLSIGGYMSGSSTFRGIKIRIYGCQIKEDDTIVRNYLPCYRISDNVVGLYDIVNGVFLGQYDGNSDWTIPATV